jgi:sec-independent protein translocase protein TatB
MFDISWTEFLLIGVVALVVIGPKELPGVMRTLGQWTRKVRSMASEFQGQFHEAMREAEMADLKQQVDDMARDVKGLDPLKGVRESVEGIGKGIETSLGPVPESPPALPAAQPAAGDVVGATPEAPLPAPPPPAAADSADAPLPLQPPEMETVGAPPETGKPETSADKAAEQDGSGHQE